MKVFVEITRFAGNASRAQLRDKVRALEDAGAAGVSAWDHIFLPGGTPERFAHTPYPCDPLTTLAAVAGLSDRLELLTVVMNSQWLHPGLLLRQFTQLAVLVGGERVTAGLGAGWAEVEFEAMGLKILSPGARSRRLEEVMRIGHQLYHEGVANLEGKYVSARSLPLCPVPPTPPRLLVGGLGDGLLQIAARYADVADVFGHPKHRQAPVEGLSRHVTGQRARALTTVDDLVERVSKLRTLTRDAGRPEDAVAVSNQVNHAVVCSSKAEAERAEARVCAVWAGIPPRSLADCPFALVGEPREIADRLVERRERYGLCQIVLQEEEDGVDFCRRVLPLLP
jgi:alkanesulfonate monooxygenase SsuD/methylene tetrahydromethanopterin reductase-like flavin-dependent oxidoreductase (luciferase family)